MASPERTDQASAAEPAGATKATDASATKATDASAAEPAGATKATDASATKATDASAGVGPAGATKATDASAGVEGARASAGGAQPPRRIDLLGRIAFVVYVVVGGVFVFGFGRAIKFAVETQTETPCRSLAPRHARLTGTVLDEAGNPVTKGEVEPVFDGRSGAPVPLRPDGTFSVHMPKGPQAVRVRAPGKAELEASLVLGASEVVDVEVTLTKAAPKGQTPAEGRFVEKGRSEWMAPDFTAKDLQGNEVRLSDFRGKLVVLNFWATWCEPCITEWPQVAKLARRLADEGDDEIAVLAVSIDQAQEDIGPFLELMTLFESPVNVLWDETTKLHEAFGSEKIPDTYFVDEEGRVEAVFVNVREWGSPDALHCVESSAGG